MLGQLSCPTGTKVRIVEKSYTFGTLYRIAPVQGYPETEYRLYVLPEDIEYYA